MATTPADPIPQRMISYATHELAGQLLELTAQQRAAVDRIVQHCTLENKPLEALFHGPGAICNHSRYYHRGQLDEHTGRWRRRPGWAHDPKFQEALATAKRL